jgi:hypothetical protein
VLEVRPIKVDGTPELPTVVKLATVSMIEQEWQAYQQHIQNRLPRIAGVAARPNLIADAGWGGLRYPAMGCGSPDIVSLRDFCWQPDVSNNELALVFDRLFRNMDNVWGYNAAAPSFSMQASYAVALPPALLVRLAPVSPDATAIAVTPETLPSLSLQPGAVVVLDGFAVRKVDLVHRTVALVAPGVSVRVQIPESCPS